MIAALVSALVGAIAALTVAIITIKNNSQRDRESDWRKLKLEIYRDFILALSGMVEGRANEDSQTRFLDAAHSVMPSLRRTF